MIECHRMTPTGDDTYVLVLSENGVTYSISAKVDCVDVGCFVAYPDEYAIRGDWSFSMREVTRKLISLHQSRQL